MAKNKLTPIGGLNYRIEVRPTVNIHQPNEIVVILTLDIEDSDGEKYRMENALSADDFKRLVRDAMVDILAAQKKHQIATMGDTWARPTMAPEDPSLN